MSMEGHNEGVDDILQASFNQAFSPPPLSGRTASEEVLAPSSESPIVPPVTELATEHTSDDSWKAEHEAQVAAWRAQSAEAREKAEKVRERWEARRAAEGEEAARRVAMGIVDQSTHDHVQQEIEWETVSNANTYPLPPSSVPSGTISPSPANPPVGAPQNQVPAPPEVTSVPKGIPKSQLRPGEDLQKWEDLHSSVASSFPSMSYPEHIETPSPLRQDPPAPGPPLNATLAIFDSSLSTRTRIKALFSSLAINMMLPFINGVMLGFGEIFAKNVVLGWLGWKSQGPGSVAAMAGPGPSSRTRLGQRKGS